MTINPALFSIITNSFEAIAQEMSVDLIRSAYSTVIREAADCSACLISRDGRVLAQAHNNPLHLNSVTAALQGALKEIHIETLTEDDVIIVNDAYSGGQHLSDIYLFSPIVIDGKMVGFSGSIGHHGDLGHSPGFNLNAHDVFEERMRFTPMAFSLSKDWNNNGILKRVIASNVRIPRDTIGDIEAQLTANETGRRRLKELVKRHGYDIIIDAATELLKYAEANMRQAISAIPDGVYHGRDVVDQFRDDDDFIEVNVTVTVSDDTLTLDFTGTSPQVKRAINCPFASTMSASYSALKMLLTKPDTPINDGSYAPISIYAPEGCILNPIPHAPVEGRNVIVMRVFQAIQAALSQALPEHIPAPGYDTRTELDLHWRNGREYFAISEQFGGGYGAGPGNDGADQLDDPLGNCRNTPVEAVETAQEFFRVLRYELRPDSGGAGRTRGGLGAIRTFEFLQDGVHMSVYSDRFLNPAKGIQGGKDGLPAYIHLQCSDGRKEVLGPRGSVYLNKGDVLEVAIGGGAGYGDPLSRDRALVVSDVTSGKISRESACRNYGMTEEELGAAGS